MRKVGAAVFSLMIVFAPAIAAAQSSRSATCDGMHTVTAADGAETDCSPYKCSGSTCLVACSSNDDCAGDASVCTKSVCDAPAKAAYEESLDNDNGGCASASSSTLTLMPLGFAFGAMAIARRRRRFAPIAKH